MKLRTANKRRKQAHQRGVWRTLGIYVREGGTTFIYMRGFRILDLEAFRRDHQFVWIEEENAPHTK